MFSEIALVTAKASVMVYDDTMKKWIPSGTSGQPGLSKVQIFEHQQNNTHRVVGRKIQDHEVSDSVFSFLVIEKISQSTAQLVYLNKWRL